MKPGQNFVFICLLILFHGLLTGQNIDQHVYAELDKSDQVPVIVLMKEQANLDAAARIKGKEAKAYFVYHTLHEFAQRSQKNLQSILRDKGIAFRSFDLVNAIALDIDRSLLELLANRSEIGAIIFDQAQPMLDLNIDRQDVREIKTRSAQPTWGVTNMAVDKLWEKGFRGQGVVIGGQDTGYEWDVDQIKDKYRGLKTNGDIDHNYNWHDAIHKASPLNSDTINPCGYDLDIPCDDHGHGTHTMGTMTGEDSTNAFGLAPLAKWIGCRNMERGWGAPSTYLECFNWFLAPTDLDGENADPSKAPHVINNSWGCPPEEGCNPENWPIMELAVQHLKAAGTVVVVSAGNDGSACGTIRNPAAMYDGSFTVGAYNINNQIAGFSSRGSVSIDSSFRIKPNVAAPGVNVLSVLRNGSYAYLSGTSMAGPHAAGLVALLISAKPELAGEVEMIEDIIEKSAIETAAEKECFEVGVNEVPNNTFGYGRINAERALELASLTSLGEKSLLDVNLFPNPNTGMLFFEGLVPDRISLFDLNGKLVYSAVLPRGVVMLPQLAQGWYQVKMEKGSDSVTKPLMVIKN